MKTYKTWPCIHSRLTTGQRKPGAILMVAVCLLAAPMISPVRAEFWYEDFTDGNLSDAGIEWFFLRDHAISPDGLLLSTDRIERPTVAAPKWPADRQGWSIRTQARLQQDHGFFGAATGATPGRSSANDTWSLINASGHAIMGSGLNESQWSDRIVTDLRPSDEDVIVQLDTLDDVMRMWVWRDGEQPTTDVAPLIEEDFDIPTAFPAIWARSNDGPSSTVFRWMAISTEHLPVNMPVPLTTSGLRAGDADQDLDFDQLDLVQVQVAAKYLTGQAATWGQGDWDGAPGGSPGNPPAGNGLFDQRDVIAALGAGTYLTGPYAAVQPNGQVSDSQTSIIYNASTGEVAVDAHAGVELTSININSADGIFTGAAAANLGGSFDNDADANLFKATFGGSFGSLSFGNVAQAGLSEQFVLSDLTVVGSLAGGGALGSVDLVYVPEPATLGLLMFGLLFGLRRGLKAVTGPTSFDG